MALQKIQHRRITLDIITRASEPLVIDGHTLEQLRQALDHEARALVDLRYYPESKYMEERHEWIGVDLPDEAPRD